MRSHLSSEAPLCFSSLANLSWKGKSFHLGLSFLLFPIVELLSLIVIICAVNVSYRKTATNNNITNGVYIAQSSSPYLLITASLFLR